MRVFISHSGKDATLAKSLVNLLQKSMRLSSDDIRCSSVDGYRLPGGVSTDERLRTEVHDAELIVGLITPDSIKSLYVAFELGARWGAKKPMIPILASGATPAHLAGPLSGINALSCSNESQINQLVEEVASYLGIVPESASSIVDEVKEVAHVSIGAASSIENASPADLSPLLPTLQLSPKATELILGAAEGGEGYIGHMTSRDGTLVYAGQRGLIEPTDHRTEAAWISALDELKERNLVEDRSGNGTRYDVTDKGYSVVDELKGENI